MEPRLDLLPQRFLMLEEEDGSYLGMGMREVRTDAPDFFPDGLTLGGRLFLLVRQGSGSLTPIPTYRATRDVDV